jgi:hypothetical protein
VKVDSVSGGPGLILPGDRVDVLVHLKRNSQDIHETSTRTFLQNIQVFAVNDIVNTERDPESKDKDKRISAQTISLLVTPAQGARLMLATEMGSVRLVMRSPEEEGEANTGNSNVKDLTGEPQSGKPEKETLTAPEVDKTPTKSNAVTDFLKNMKTQLDKPKAAVPNETWTMLVLQPNGINEVVLEADKSSNAAKTPQGGWRLLRSNLIGSGSNGNPQPPAPITNTPTTTQPDPPAPNPPTPDPTANPTPDPQADPTPSDPNSITQDPKVNPIRSTLAARQNSSAVN